MARYIFSSNFAITIDKLFPLLGEILRSCNFEVIYDKGDYIMGREIPGQVTFAQLVTIEALIDKSRAKSNGTWMNFVLKNEELPLHNKNHCYEMFENVQKAIKDHPQSNLSSAPTQEVTNPMAATKEVTNILAAKAKDDDKEELAR